MMQPLTKRQRQILEFLERFIKAHGFAPSLMEIGEAFGFSSLATTHAHLSHLQEKGYIFRAWNRGRSIELRGLVEGCCPTCGREFEKSAEGAKVSIETGRKVCDDQAVG